MADYIDRAALLKKVFPYGGIDKKTYAINAKAVEKAIVDAPAADVVAVVRCGDCVHRTSGRPSCTGRQKDFFCANGERRESGNEELLGLR